MTVVSVDTNVLRGDLGGLRLLAGLASQVGLTLCITDVVLDEVTFDRRVAVEKKLAAIEAAVQVLETLEGAEHLEKLVLPVAEDMLESELFQYKSAVQLVETHPTEAREALHRETMRLPPAKSARNKPGEGGRDVAIWLTSVRHAAERGEDLVFVSNDGAFGDSELLPSLAQEALRSGVTVTLAKGVDDVFELLGTTDDEATDSAYDWLREAVESGRVDLDESLGFRYALHDMGPYLPQIDRARWYTNGANWTKLLRPPTSVRGFRLEDSTQIAFADTSWLAQGRFEQWIEPEVGEPRFVTMWRVDYEVDLTVMVTRLQGDVGVTAVYSGPRRFRKAVAYDLQQRAERWPAAGGV